MATKGLTRREVLARMRRGDLPTYGGGYVVRGVFDDGARASSVVMRGLERDRLVDYPAKASVSSPWTLTEKGRERD